MSNDSAIQQYIDRLPHHAEALQNLQSLRAYQNDLAQRSAVTWDIRHQDALAQWRVGRPLLAENALPISPILFLDALSGLKNLFPLESPLHNTLQGLLQAKTLDPLHVADFLENLPASGQERLEKLAAEADVDFSHAAVLVRTALAPLLSQQAEPVRQWLPESGWQKGVCPICGAEPDMARLDKKNGQRYLACFWCETEWTFPRLSCPYCTHDGPPAMRYFTLEKDEPHRVDCCDHCHHYVKTVDERTLAYTPNLLVEDFLTAHLDVLAEKEGCR